MTNEVKTMLSKRSDVHLARKIWHVCMGLVILCIYLGFQMNQGVAVALLGTILIFTLILERARLRNQDFNEFISRVFRYMMRANELNNLSGIPYYLAGVIIAIGIFPKPVAVLSILYLVCGDPIASFFGIRWGDRGPRWPDGKSYIGSLAGILACIGVGWIFLLSFYFLDFRFIWIAILGGLVGGVVELLPLKIDDNFTIPVISGFFLWALFLLFEIPLLF